MPKKSVLLLFLLFLLIFIPFAFSLEDYPASYIYEEIPGELLTVPLLRVGYNDYNQESIILVKFNEEYDSSITATLKIEMRKSLDPEKSLEIKAMPITSWHRDISYDRQPGYGDVKSFLIITPQPGSSYTIVLRDMPSTTKGIALRARDESPGSEKMVVVKSLDIVSSLKKSEPAPKQSQKVGAPSTINILKSDFFKNDPIAISIVNGDNYQLSEDNYFTEGRKINTLSFEYKLINAFRQLGYKRLTYIESPNDSPITVTLHKFQRKHNMPTIDYLGKSTLLLIDEQLFQREQEDKRLAEQYPPFVKFIDAPINEPPKEHLAALYASFFSAMPDDIYEPTWTIDEFGTSLIAGLGGTLGKVMDSQGTRVLAPNEAVDAMNNKEDFRFCGNAYYQKFKALYGGNCINPPSVIITSRFVSDILYMGERFTHEYGHGVGKTPVSLNGEIKQADYYFGKISFDMGDLQDWEISDVKLRPDNGDEFISGDAKLENKEDFAESFSAYIHEGNIFREKAKNNIYLKQKYDFLKEHIFKGVEFDTGSIESYNLWHSKNQGIPFHPLGYHIEDPDWVWDYQYKILEETPTQPTSTTYIYANGQRIAKSEENPDGTKEVSYVYNDYLGSPRVITAMVGAAIKWRADYKPFGQAFGEIGINKIQYNSKEYNSITGLHYYGARYYDAGIGRFITADSVKGNIADPQSLNLYVYTRNNPMKYIDPSGNQFTVSELIKHGGRPGSKLGMGQEGNVVGRSATKQGEFDQLLNKRLGKAGLSRSEQIRYNQLKMDPDVKTPTTDELTRLSNMKNRNQPKQTKTGGLFGKIGRFGKGLRRILGFASFVPQMLTTATDIKIGEIIKKELAKENIGYEYFQGGEVVTFSDEETVLKIANDPEHPLNSVAKQYLEVKDIESGKLKKEDASFGAQMQHIFFGTRGKRLGAS